MKHGEHMSTTDMDENRRSHGMRKKMGEGIKTEKKKKKGTKRLEKKRR